MNENELVRKLNSVGKKAFIMCFDLYQDYAEGKMSRESCVSQQVAIGLSNESGAAIRCGNAKAIFQGQMVCLRKLSTEQESYSLYMASNWTTHD